MGNIPINAGSQKAVTSNTSQTQRLKLLTDEGEEGEGRGKREKGGGRGRREGEEGEKCERDY